ncbi:origin recognition complex subunit 2-domain-containing protein [Pyronema domesticum]|uniref:Origin recognition complex subunit 2 n=1 Tax=Pyronema omphalodes (strain CBS 100304) TaxID=1076935 RepID=U4L1U8_PYROM|nr:origin recognition complex subunit 2-domain-containing protein [Pyronema domesticum]CCX09626.1 Similar to Origin recognition complex subunit 2; acc. no. Q09142 [Pyronema omphalodes CBS 100304]
MKRKSTSPDSSPRQTRSTRTNTANINPPVLLVAPETPSKRRLRTAEDSRAGQASPSPRKAILKDSHLATPKRTDRVRFHDSAVSPPSVVTNADHSARRKSTRRLLDRRDSDEESEDEEEDLVQRIYGGEGSDESSAEEEEVLAKGKPGRKPKQKRQITPPPSTLEGPDSYFHQNRKTRQQTSTATLASLSQLDHSSYFNLLRSHPPDHVEDREYLHQLHTDSFGQWVFELSQGFNILLYGYGSKRKLLGAFASKVYTHPGSVVVINGYLPGLTVKDILTTLATALLGTNHNARLGVGMTEILHNILSLLDEPDARKVTIILHNLDGEALRNERSQATIARLVAHPKISLVASIDHIRAPLLWDAARVSQFNFLWHDATTFEPYTVEIPADEVLSLVDGAGRAGGTKGVKYVLASLPSNARSLFRILVSHQLQAMMDDDNGGVGTGKAKGRKVDASEYGVEYRVLYQRAMGEFICSNDVAFRTLLKEFQDHQMITSKKDTQGTEILWAPFRKEDLEGILEDEMEV